MNPVENMWSETKRQCSTLGLSSLSKMAMTFGPLCHAWNEVALSTRYIRSLIEFMTRRMKSVVGAEGFWTFC